jgi:phosphatidylserine decarboxylase
MAKALQEWIDTDVAAVRDRPVSWLSEQHFFRDPLRPVYSDAAYFFAPADGIVVYQETVRPDEPLVNIKGRMYSLQDAMRDPGYDRESLVIGIFMTFYDVHVNRVPYGGRLSYRELDPIESHNYPMLPVEKAILDDLRIDLIDGEYLFNNQRMLNRVFSPALGDSYYILQIADYDVDSITPFELKQNWPVEQNARFSQVRFGSQVDLIVPCSKRLAYRTVQESGVHVEAGLDTLIRVEPR